MDQKSELRLRQKVSGGHTAQYETLAEGLRQAAEAMEADMAYLVKKGYSVEIASLRMEARCATIVLISAALCESVANTILATVLTPEAFAEIERKEQMPKKWSHRIPNALKFTPSEALIQELWVLKQVRDAVVHAKATVFDEDQAVYIEGNGDLWDHLKPEVARKFVTLPLRVAETIPTSAELLLRVIAISLRDRQPRLPRVHVAEIISALETIEPNQLEAIRRAIDRLEKTNAP